MVAVCPAESPLFGVLLDRKYFKRRRYREAMAFRGELPRRSRWGSRGGDQK